MAVLAVLPFPTGAETPATDVNNGASTQSKSAVGEDPEDPSNLLQGIKERRVQKDSFFRQSPLHGAHELTDRWKQSLYDASGLELGFAYNQLFQGVSDSLPGADKWGTVSTVDFIGTWELLNRGTPTQGQLVFGLQGRWNWGTTGPENLGTEALGSLSRPGNTFAEYSPTFLPVRNLYWQQGSKEAGWVYRIGKITPDATLATSAHIAAPLTFTSTAGVGAFAIALPDSGLGGVVNWYLSDRVKILALVSDSNGDRQDWGDIGEGDLFKAVELGVKMFPRTEKAGWSKLTVWHNDGTKDGSASNGNLGPDGRGFLLKLEQELTADGRLIGIAKYGWSDNDSALYESQANLLFLYYNPDFIGHIQNDLVGIGLNYVEPSLPGTRGEYNPEIFYRFPFFPNVDVTLTYHSIINPALDPNNDHASAYSLRLRSTF
ncbi:MAG: hypothetical protein AB9Q22_06605 [Candidatus Reddybacter sp.]